MPRKFSTSNDLQYPVHACVFLLLSCLCLTVASKNKGKHVSLLYNVKMAGVCVFYVCLCIYVLCMCGYVCFVCVCVSVCLSVCLSVFACILKYIYVCYKFVHLCAFMCVCL